MVKVRLSDAAKVDLRAIYRFGVRQFGVRQSDQYLSMLKSAITLLGDFPNAGSRRTGAVPPVRVRPSGSHIIVYVVGSEGVMVLRVRHGSEDWLSRSAGDRS